MYSMPSRTWSRMGSVLIAEGGRNELLLQYAHPPTGSVLVSPPSPFGRIVVIAVPLVVVDLELSPQAVALPPVVAVPDVTEQTPASKVRSEEHTSELQSPCNLVCRLLLEK